MPVDHEERARRAWPHLVRLARSGGEPFSYGELCAKLGDVHHRAAGRFLGVIQKYCAVNKLSALQALAVNRRTRVPGAGYCGVQGRRAHAKEVERVRAHKWPVRAPNFGKQRGQS